MLVHKRGILRSVQSGLRCFSADPHVGPGLESKSKSATPQLYGGLTMEAFTMMVEKGAPFILHNLKPKVSNLTHNSFSMVLPFNETLVGNTMTPCLHGGVVATMMDHTAGFCAWASLPDAYHRVSTVQLTVEYLLPPPCEDLHFDAVIEHKSNRLIRLQAICWDNQRRHQIALARGMFNIYKGKDNLADLMAVHARRQETRKQYATKTNVNTSSPSST